MVERKYEGRLGEIVTQVAELEKSKPYDRRKREYKDIESKVDVLSNEARSIIVGNAIEVMKSLGYEFKFQNDSSKPAVMRLGDKFTVYAIPEFHVWSSSAHAYFVLDDKTNRQYSSSWVRSDDKDFSVAAKNAIEQKHKEFIEKERIGNVNGSHAQSFMSKVETDWTSRSGDWMYASENRPWAGNKVELEYEEIGDRSSMMNDTRAEVEFYREKFVAHFDFRAEFETEEEALAFWNKAKEMVESTTKYVRKQRRD